MDDLKDLKKKTNQELDKIMAEFIQAKDQNRRKYLVKRSIDLINSLIIKGISPELFEPIKQRLENIEKYTDIYSFSLPEQLREQKVIIADSIQSSPYHLKKLELKNTSMVQFPENLQN